MEWTVKLIVRDAIKKEVSITATRDDGQGDVRSYHIRSAIIATAAWLESQEVV